MRRATLCCVLLSISWANVMCLPSWAVAQQGWRWRSQDDAWLATPPPLGTGNPPKSYGDDFRPDRDAYAEDWLSWLLAGSQLGLGVGGATLFGIPPDQAAASIAVGTAAGSVTSGLILLAFDDICDSTSLYTCILRTFGMAMLLVAADIGTQVPLVHLMVGDDESADWTDGGRIGWMLGWVYGGLTLHAIVFGVSRVNPMASRAGRTGLVVLGNAILATAVTGILYGVGADTTEVGNTAIPLLQVSF